jgi:hypothetical protein
MYSTFVPKISTTIEDIKEYINNFIDSSSYFEEESQMDDELDLLRNDPVCSNALLEKLSDRLGNLDSNKLKNFTKDQQSNSEVMKATSCTSQSVVYLSPIDQGDNQQNFKIKHYIKNLSQIGEKSAFGNAFTADLKNTKDFFVVKTGQDVNASNSLVHELVVGLYGTNNLRKKIPNFAYVYGGFKCSEPQINKDKTVNEWCINNKFNYIMYENIDNSVSVEEFVKTCTGEEFINVYLQIVYALKTAQQEIDFTHYDLHSDNILIKSTKDNKVNVIKYDTEIGEQYISTKHVPIIIDYGHSHIKYKNKDYGIFDNQKYSVFPNKSWIFYDLYKILMFSMYIALKFYNYDVLKYGKTIFKFFNQIEDFEDSINDQLEYFYILPLLEKNKNLNIDEFATYINHEIKFNFLSSTSNNLPIFGNIDNKSTENEVYNDVGIDPESEIQSPEDIIDFFILDKKLKDTLEDKKLMELTSKFKNNYAKTANTINTHRSYLLTRMNILAEEGNDNSLVDYDEISSIFNIFTDVFYEFIKYNEIYDYLRKRYFSLSLNNTEATKLLCKIHIENNNIRNNFSKNKPTYLIFNNKAKL